MSKKPLYLVFALDFALDHRARDDCALHNRWLDDRWLDDRWLNNSRLDNRRLRGVGLLAVLLHLDGAAVDGLARGVGAAGGPGRGGGPPSLRLSLTPTWHLEVAKLTVTVTQATVIIP